jgi:hypothetical protein
MSTTSRGIFSIGVAAILAGCGGAGTPGGALPIQNASSHKPGQRTFLYTGTPQRFEVPHDVTAIKVVAIGGKGDSDPYRHGYSNRSTGGYGGRTEAIIPVTPHEKLYVYVGGNGSSQTGGFNGGGNGSTHDSPDGFGGGGASDIREHGDKLSDRVVVAGGGGGAGGDSFGYGTGYSNGGKGGGLIAGSGSGGGGGYGRSGGFGGGGGTQSAGGDGGNAEEDCYYYQYGKPGDPGSFGLGGSGGDGGLRSFGAGGGGGGGGGGYYGGGAGGAGCADYSSYSNSGGGGGGGSSYIEASATKARMWQGWRKPGHALIVLSW